MPGESVVYVKDQLGHSGITITVNTYTYWIPGTNRQVVDKLPSISTSAIAATAKPSNRAAPVRSFIPE
jgi:hypothetical protein